MINLRALANVVQGSYATQVSTTGTVYVTTNLAATITPTSNTSQIKIEYSVAAGKSAGNANNEVNVQVYFGAVAIVETQRTSSLYTASSMALNGTISDIYLHSPATTAATTYTLYFKSNISGQTVYVHNDSQSSRGHIILSEIPA